MATAISARGLSKQYRIGQFRGGYDTLREDLTRLGQRALGRLRTHDSTSIWAMREVDLDIEEGEIVAIIGRNGAGKTTLLRLLSRITEPTSGYVDIRGRLGSLLEVGTGFHPELTGRENIFLNGAILGMRRVEIARSFEQIVEFAGIERFLDTPVKRYSSGMYVRLAFSVAAHLEPEILLVDEVLAVGDMEFQRRCLGRMEEIGKSGRTVLFVSHNMQAVARLCPRAVLLDSGRVVADGQTDYVVARYLHGDDGTAASVVWGDDAPGGDIARLRSVRVVAVGGEVTPVVDVRNEVGIELVFDSLGGDIPFVPWVALYNEQGTHVFSAMDVDPAWRQPVPRGRYTTVAWIPPNLLNEGTITVSVSLNTFVSGGKADRQAHVDGAVTFQVVDPGDMSTARGHYPGVWPGPVRPLLGWETRSPTAIRQPAQR